MDQILLVAGIIAIIVGIVGSVLPLPGPPLAYAGMLAVHFSKYGQYSSEILFGFGLLTVIITVLDYYVPIWGTKKFGGSKWGSIGSGIGLFVGIFLGPFGIFIGAFAGAFIGEYYYQKDQKIAFKAAIGSFLGIMAGMVVKIILCLSMLFFTIYTAWQNFK